MHFLCYKTCWYYSRHHLQWKSTQFLLQFFPGICKPSRRKGMLSPLLPTHWYSYHFRIFQDFYIYGPKNNYLLSNCSGTARKGLNVKTRPMNSTTFRRKNTIWSPVRVEQGKLADRSTCRAEKNTKNGSGIFSEEVADFTWEEKGMLPFLCPWEPELYSYTNNQVQSMPHMQQVILQQT